jgi:hypothetical protein
VDSEQAGAVKVLTRMYQALFWEQVVEMRDWKQVRMASDVTSLALRARVELDLEKRTHPNRSLEDLTTPWPAWAGSPAHRPADEQSWPDRRLEHPRYGQFTADRRRRTGHCSRPRIGPTTRPTKRSIAVQRPPPATWNKSSAHC